MSNNNKTVKKIFIHTVKLESNLITRMIQKFTFLAFFLLVGNLTAWAQPINDDCSGAIPLEVKSSREFGSFTNELASSSTVIAPSCGQYQGADVWFKLILPDNKIIIDLATSVNPKVVLSLYKNTCNQLDEIKCSDEGTSSDASVSSRIKYNPNDNNDNLGAGDEIYVRVFRYGATVGATFQIGAYLKNSPLVLNDFCDQAIELISDNGSFEFQTFSTEGASETDNVDLPVACSDCDENDIWFKTEVPTSGKLNIETNPGTITPAIVVYEGSCTNLNKYAFSKNGSIDSGGEIFIDDADMAGETIYIRAISLEKDEEGIFDIAIVEPKQDVCEDAIEITNISLVEKYIGYTNQYAVLNGAEPTCGIFNDKDIWFLIRVPSNGKLLIDTKVDATYDVKPVLTAYTGTCDSLIQYDCDFFGSMVNPFGAQIDIDDSALANQYIYLRMYGYDNSVGGRFEMSTIQPAALPVDLIEFTAEVVNNEEVYLDWQTASELNNDYFIVEHSIDGKEFTPVTHIDGKGTTSERQNYQFVHDEPFFGENYYRLKQVDFDGQFEYSRIVIAVIKMEETKINVYPNPALVSKGISLRWNGDFGKEDVQLRITNSVGKKVLEQSIDVKHERQVYVDFSALNLDAGTYYLTISDKNSLITHQKINLIKD